MAENQEDLKKEAQTAGDGQPGKETQAEDAKKLKDLEEQLKKEQELREKAEQDRDNYREGMLSAKAKKMSLSDDDDEPQPKPQPQESQPAAKDDEENAWKEVEKRAERIALEKLEAKTKAEVRQNESIAIKKFLKDNPELLANDAIFEGIKEEYVNRNGKSVEGIMFDLERAYKYYKLEHNMPLNKENLDDKKLSTEKDLANMKSGGGGSPSKIDGFSDEESQIMAQFNVSPELFAQFKKKALNGEMGVPDEVLRILRNNN